MNDQSMMHFKWHTIGIIFIFLNTIVAENKQSQITILLIASVIEGKNRPNARPRLFCLLLQIKSRSDFTNWLCLLSFCPCSPRHAAHQLSKYNAATGGFVSIHIIIPSCHLVVHQNTLKQVESHIVMPPYTSNTASSQWQYLPPSL